MFYRNRIFKIVVSNMFCWIYVSKRVLACRTVCVDTVLSLKKNILNQPLQLDSFT